MKFRLQGKSGQSLHSGAPGGNRGVALVMTLILLSVITFMAVAFLVLSRGERSSVGAVTDSAVARLGADEGLEHAKTLLIGAMLANDNQFNFDLLVSTNYQNPLGFVSGNYNVTNASYTYADGTTLNANDALINLTNLFFSPRPPVYVNTPIGGGNFAQDFRFYLDVNRNGRFETNGLLPVIGWNNLPILDPTNGVPITNFFVGDPEWIGGLEYPDRPDRPHGPNNRFLYRYAYLVVPSGKTLDVNYIHNSAKSLPGRPPFDFDFFRNQGVGPWEINLAAFLRDLNTNIWTGPPDQSYNYLAAGIPQYANRGSAFDDAFDVLRFRNPDFPNPNKSVVSLFGNFGRLAFINDGIDGYSAATMPMVRTGPLPIDPDIPVVNTHWFGAESVNHYFTTQDLLDPAKTSLPFVQRIQAASGTNSSYDRYTFYRMLSQLGTDTAPDPDQRINLNYDNRYQANADGVIAATNFAAWRPVDFFTAAANQLLKNAGYDFDVNRIQIYPTNFYTPSVHRILQLAANIYDATTNQLTVPSGTNTIAYPTVFRPLFLDGATNGTRHIWINGYQEVINPNQIGPFVELPTFGTNTGIVAPNNMVYGIPLIIGAKKGLPNFNELAMQTEVSVTRKLQFLKRSANDKSPYQTNQMYTIGISNRFGLEAWNSYSNAFRRGLSCGAVVEVQALVTNQYNEVVLLDRATLGGTNTVQPPAVWPGFAQPQAAQFSFFVPFHPDSNSFYFVTNRPYSTVRRQFVRPGLINWEPGFEVPHLWLVLKTRMLFSLVDTTVVPNRIVDYVTLSQTEEPLYITGLLMADARQGVTYTPDGSVGGMFNTNRGLSAINNTAAPTFGVRNQIGVCAGLITADVAWNPSPTEVPRGMSKEAAIDFFRYNIAELPSRTPGSRIYKTNEFYAPYVPTRTVYFFTSLQANDPLVHYTMGDLMNLERTNRVAYIPDDSPLGNLGKINNRYEPWGGNPEGKSASTTKFQLGVKDPLVRRSDDWDFPTNKFPNIGWLGRVHRGTPWQTVYLKAPEVDDKGMKVWQKWTGNFQTVTNWDGKGKWKWDADFTVPQRDRELLDVFTTALTEQGARGRLSINQSGLAAWSAVLSGVVAITNIVSDADAANNPFLAPQYDVGIIEPAGVYSSAPPPGVTPPPMVRIVESINYVRANSTNQFPKKTFMRLGDILSVPELTVGANPVYVGNYPDGYWSGASPFINLGNPNLMDPTTKLTPQQRDMLNDAAYERLPQQILGLLHCDQPRFVVYSFGQALKPAPESVVMSGPFFGMVTNYQVVAESATRAVLRVEGAPDNPRVVVEKFNALPPD